MAFLVVMIVASSNASDVGDDELIALRLSVDRELHRRGILRADGPLSGEYAEHLSAKHLGITLLPNLVSKDFDGVDADGRKVQIKARVVDAVDRPTSWDFRERPSGFETLLAFLFDRDMNVLRVFKIPFAVVAELARPNRGRWSFRWNRALALDPRVTVVPWPV